MDPFTLGAGFGFGALLVGIIFAVICNALAKEKGRSAGWWGLLGFLTTFLALIVLVLLPARTRIA
ncbi:MULTISPECIES: hypothetical protein [Brevibacterium]|jgi:hypothetical protein|uniref:Uncharacterized protein n=1 Tax=Brevibacterium casei TaxID=33889 RepID=A0A7T3ZY54_9MICO|nr:MULTISPECIES: hypothetical protein [Brevibacterium]QQB13813.1 hypothetical protein I6H47_13620 [Brevibacterium casei]